MRILMIVRQFYPWIGGSERQAQKLSQALISQDVDVKVVTGWWFRHTPQKETIDGIPIYRNFTMWEMFRIRGLRKFGAYLYMLTLFIYLWRRRREYDVIHAHVLNYHTFVAVLAGKWFNKKTIVKLANSGLYSDINKMRTDRYLPGTRFMLPVALQADCFVALTPVIVKELQAAGVPAERIVEIPNGTEVNTVTPKANYRLHDPVTLIFVGRLHPQKGLDILLAAFKKARDAQPALRWRLLIMGDGPLRHTLETMAQELDSTDAVVFCGQTDDVQSYLSQADLFILPSRAEGMSNALLEAMTHGLPCIVSNDGANAALISHDENGLTIDCAEPDRLSQAIVSLVDDEGCRERLGRIARQTMENRFAIERVAEQYITLYRKLAENIHVVEKR